MLNKAATHLFSLGQLIFIFLLMAGGVVLLALAHAPHLRLIFAEAMNSSLVCAYLGYGALFFAFVFLVLFYRLHKGYVYRLSMRPHTAAVEKEVVASLVGALWKEKFPDTDHILKVFLHPSNRIEIIAEVPSHFFVSCEKSLQEVEKELGALLSAHLGTKEEFFLTLVVH